MDELKRKTMEIISNLNNDWTTAIKDGQKSGIDLSQMFAKFSKHVADLDMAFAETKTRLSGKGKKGWF